MSDLKNSCLRYFQTDNFYEILGIESSATEQQIKKAYHKRSLLVHPDRVSNDEKIEATEKFKILSKVHSILQDQSKRKIYDESGTIMDLNDADFNWLKYWSGVFKTIDLDDIRNYERDYIGSDLELEDILSAYVGTKGNIDLMLDMIPFSNCQSVPRIKRIIRKLVDEGKVEEYSAFFNESFYKRKRRWQHWERSKRKAEYISRRYNNYHERFKNYEDSYIGSETEVEDIMSAYAGTKGNVARMLDRIPFSNFDSVPRFQTIIRTLINDGKVEEYQRFFETAENNRRWN